jgi:hypothetical protein
MFSLKTLRIRTHILSSRGGCDPAGQGIQMYMFTSYDSFPQTMKGARYIEGKLFGQKLFGHKLS